MKIPSQNSPNFPVGKFILAGIALLALLLVFKMPKFNQRLQSKTRVEETNTAKKEAKRIADEQYKQETESLDVEMILVEGGTFM